MDNEISKAIKRKTDAQMRMNATDLTPVVNEGVGNTTIINDPSKYIIPMVAGKNITIGTSGSNKVINALMNILAGDNITVTEPDENGAVTISGNIGGKPIDLTGLADGYVLTYDITSDSFILAELPDMLSQATELELGGIRAKARTTENAEVVIDEATGKLYAPESGESYTLPQASETTLGGIKAKEKTSESSEVAIDSATGKLYAPAAGGGGGFTDLSDAPDSFVGQTGKVPQVNDTEDGLEFVSPFVPYTEGGVLVEDFESAEQKIPYELLTGAVISTVDSGLCVFVADNTTAGRGIRFSFNMLSDGEFSFRTSVYQYSVNYAPVVVRLDGIQIATMTATEKVKWSAWTLKTFSALAGPHILEIATIYHSGYRTGFKIDDFTIPAGRTYLQGISEHSGIPSLAENPDMLLASKSNGLALEFLPKDTFLKTPEIEGTAGQVLMTDGAGGRSWGDIVHPTPMISTGAALPTADISYRGQIFTILGDVGVADTSYICQKDATDAYVWTPI